jgi:arabinose-5-phosphate isomerase
MNSIGSNASTSDNTGTRPAHEAAIRTVAIERRALKSLADALASSELRQAFNRAVALIAPTGTRVIVTGVGKSGLVGRKIAATLASTGTPALFMHSSDASHGDLGMISDKDLVLALSWSGETTELGPVVTYCRRFRVPLMVMTSRPDSSAGKAADICLALPLVREACPHRLAPTSSTIVQLAFGDALAIALIEAKGFSAADFRRFHPGGRLGAQLLVVRDLMATGSAVPRVSPNLSVLEATLEVSSKRYGCTAVVDQHGRLLGAFSHADLRRSLMEGSLEDPVSQHMAHSPLVVEESCLASAALAIMNLHKVAALFVCSGDHLRGIIHIHELLERGIN